MRRCTNKVEIAKGLEERTCFVRSCQKERISNQRREKRVERRACAHARMSRVGKMQNVPDGGGG